jgi:steroid delta-isomerase-like uncharacterized protein
MQYIEEHLCKSYGRMKQIVPATPAAIAGEDNSLKNLCQRECKQGTTMDNVEEIVRKFHESWDLRDPDRGAAIIAEDCQFEDVARGEMLPGPEAYKRDYRRWRTAFPDGALEITNVIVQENWAVVEFTNRGTQTGPLHSSLGEFPPSGRAMEVRYCSVMRVQDGKVVEGRDYYDSASIARQLGLVG